MRKTPRQFLILFLTLYAFLVAYLSQRSEILKDFTHSSAIVRSQISQHVLLSNGFIDQMSLVGADFFATEISVSSPLNRYLKASPADNSFNMDSIKNTPYIGYVGNLTGTGHPGSNPEMTENINLALLYNTHFKAFYDSLPGIAWVYYMGSEGFVMMYPWTSSDDFSFSPALFDAPFYQIGLPENNPSRVRRWTPPYRDAAGKGLMVTLSKPLYYQEVLRGVVSVDVTLRTLADMMDPRYHSFMVDEDGHILAANDVPSVWDKKLLTLEEYAGKEKSEKFMELKKNNSDSLQSADAHYVYVAAIDNCPWTFYNELSYWEVFLKSSFAGAPVLLIGLLLLLSSNANERRKKIEHILTRTVRELEESRLQLHTAASIDFLTGALNRRSITERLNEEISRSTRYGSTFSLILGDIDHFKNFNDTYGHAAGDAALKHIVAVISSGIRSSDLLCRWGGEEFLIILPDTGYREALRAAEKLRIVISTSCFVFEGIDDICITMSYGVSEYTHEKGLDHNIIQADDALYQAKDSGRNCVCGFNDIYRAP